MAVRGHFALQNCQSEGQGLVSGNLGWWGWIRTVTDFVCFFDLWRQHAVLCIVLAILQKSECVSE